MADINEESAQRTAVATYVASLTADLSRAVAERQFTVSFQPVVDLGTAEVISAEALARWHHPAQGDLNPELFIDAVERSGLLGAFSQAVLDQSLEAAATWCAAGFRLPVAVNVSPRSVLDPDFPEIVAQRLARSGVPAELLIIELTESLALSQLVALFRHLRAILQGRTETVVSLLASLLNAGQGGLVLLQFGLGLGEFRGCVAEKPRCSLEFRLRRSQHTLAVLRFTGLPRG